MPYTIASRGRPIGTTELDFIRIDGRTRSGWFLPNALGQTLMPTLALVLPAMRAFVARDVQGEDGQSLVRPNFRQSTLYADLAEALDRVAALELSLHHEDGGLIPTELVGLQDTHQLLSLIDWDDLHDESDHSFDVEDEDFDLPFDFDAAGDLELPALGWQEEDDELDFAFSGDEAWMPGVDPDPNERYQVHILLSQENAIP